MAQVGQLVGDDTLEYVGELVEQGLMPENELISFADKIGKH